MRQMIKYMTSETTLKVVSLQYCQPKLLKLMLVQVQDRPKSSSTRNLAWLVPNVKR